MGKLQIWSEVGQSTTWRISPSRIALANNSAAQAGGGIYNEYYATLTVTNSTLVNNAADWGGGIYNQYGKLTVANSTLENNSARSVNGGGIFSDGTLTVTNSRLENNWAADMGGGICSYSQGTVTVANSTLANNSANHSGGGILAATLTLTNSTLANNWARFFGGGVVNNGATVTVANSTLAANSADMEGGGIMNWGTLTVTSSTLANNSAVQNGGGIYNTSYGTLTVANSVFGGNTAAWGPDVGNRGVIAAAQYNVIGNGANSGVMHGINGNQVGVNPRLDSAGLQDHGGPTQTIALLLDSPAIDAGDDDLALDPAGNPLTTDERGAGFPRMIGSAVDVGAWECPNVPPTVTREGIRRWTRGRCGAWPRRLPTWGRGARTPRRSTGATAHPSRRAC